MALAATRLGVPARVVVGAVVPEGGVVQGRDVEAWVELRVDDGTWRTLPTERFTSATPPEADRFDQNPIPTSSCRPSRPSRTPQGPSAPAERRSGDGTEAGADEVAWWPWLLGALVLGVGSIPVVKRYAAGDASVTTWSRAATPGRGPSWSTPPATSAPRSRRGHPAGAGGLARVRPALDARAWEADLVIFGLSDPTA